MKLAWMNAKVLNFLLIPQSYNDLMELKPTEKK